MDNVTFSDLACGLNLIAAVTGMKISFIFIFYVCYFALFYLYALFYLLFSI